MNQEQIKSLVRWVIATFGPFVTSHGYVSSSNWEMIGGIILSAIPFVWGLLVHTQANTVTMANAIPAVAGVVMANTGDGRALASAVGQAGAVVAGSVPASKVAA